MRSFATLLLTLVMTFSAGPAASGAVCEARVKLHDGKIRSSDLSAALMERFGIKGVELDAGEIDLSGLGGSLFVQALNASLGEGCSVALQGDALVLHLDTKKLPRNFDTFRAAARTFTATAAPNATAEQRRYYGLLLPKEVDSSRRMVVLVHGLDCNRANWYPMAELLIGEGYQVAYFTYPSDGPLEESAALLAREMRAVRETFPSVPLDMIAHSMGGLVARGYVEGDDYLSAHGGIDRLILVGTPNLGSRWASYRIGLELQEHWALWRHQPGWSPTWMITDGLGEAGRDLKPTSAFLKRLNDRPRRGGVKYTVIAGAQHPIAPMGADALDGAANLVPDRAANWWGFRHTERGLRRAADNVRHKTGKSDGPVSVKNTKLAGVEDHVVLPADHTALYYPVDGQRPAAWEIIRERLAR